MRAPWQRRRPLAYAVRGGLAASLAVLGWWLSEGRMPEDGARATDVLRGVRVVGDEGPRRLLGLETSRGTTEARHYPVVGARRGAVWLPGATRAWSTPARGLYPRLIEELAADGITSAWVRYRDPANLSESVFDAAAAVGYLEREGAETVAVTGHSMGGAVAIRAALTSQRVRTVVALATQAAGTGSVGRLGPRCSLLVVHGERDRTLLPLNAAEVYRAASNPKRLVLYPNANHALDEAAEEVSALVREWLREYLGPGAAAPGPDHGLTP